MILKRDKQALQQLLRLLVRMPREGPVEGLLAQLLAFGVLHLHGARACNQQSIAGLEGRLNKFQAAVEDRPLVEAQSDPTGLDQLDLAHAGIPTHQGQLVSSADHRGHMLLGIHNHT